jgi:Amt family ammonium transporter
MGAQVWIQFKGVLITVVFVAIASYIILKIVDMIVGLRVTEEQETEGLDIASHDERGYNL